MRRQGIRLFQVFSVFGVAAILLSLLVGAAMAQPTLDNTAAGMADAQAGALIAPQSQVTGTQGGGQAVQPPQPSGPTTTNNNFFVNMPSWVWIVVVALIILLVALIAGGRGGGTTVIKD